MRIVLVVKSLVGGGAEKVLVLLAKGFQAKGHEVFVITMSGKQSDVYTLSAGINRIDIAKDISKSNPILKNWSLINALRSAVKLSEPDVVVSFVHLVNVRTIIALFGVDIPIVVSEHTDSRLARLPFFWRVMRRLVYPFADTLVCVSEGVAKGFYWSKSLQVIYNPIELPSNRDINKKASLEVKLLGGMGRFHYAKGFDLLIDAFGKISDMYPYCNLIIYGDGAERRSLEQKVRELGLNHRISLPGFTCNPGERLSELDLFVVSSRWEGFCLVLVEALAQGVPCISFNCPSGPSEIIKNDYNGYLIEPNNIEALADSISLLINDVNRRESYIKNGYETVGKFGLDEIVGQWEILLHGLITSNSRFK